MWNIYEQPWTLLIIAVVIFLVLSALRSFYPEKIRRMNIIVPLLIAILGLAIDFAVKTDQEKIKAVVKQAINAVKNEDVDALGMTLAADYSDSFHQSKQALLSYARIILVPPFIENIYASILDTQISEKTAEVTLLNRIIFDSKSNIDTYTSVLLVKAKLIIEKQPDDKWLIKQTEILTINDRPAGWKDTDYRSF
ncbi:MAG: hypothetical protein WCZ89_07290 [Phycisphaerae bacterium]